MKKILLSLSLLTTFMVCCATAKADPCVNDGVLELGPGQNINNCQVYTNNGLLIIDSWVTIGMLITGQSQFINKGTVLIKKNAILQLLAKDQNPSLENDNTIYVQGMFDVGPGSNVINNGNIFIANTGKLLVSLRSDQNEKQYLDNNGLIVNDGTIWPPGISNSQSGIFNLNSSGKIISLYPSGVPTDHFDIYNNGEFNICQNGTIPDGASLSGKPINFLQYTC